MTEEAQDLVRLLYVSRRGDEVSDATVVDGIVLPAIRRNLRLDLTGCLWFGGSRFVQALEGPGARVKEMYGRIERDTRHTDVRLLEIASIDRRLFERWSMRLIACDDESSEVRGILASMGFEDPAGRRRSRFSRRAFSSGPAVAGLIVAALVAAVRG